MSFTPQNDLEHALIAATRDPAARPDFYRALIEADLFLIKYSAIEASAIETSDNTDAAEGEEIDGTRTLPEDETLSFQSIEIDEHPYLPVFSSLDCLQAFLQADGRFISMNAVDLMTAVEGIDLFLNPGGDYAKDFTQEEMRAIVDGSILQLLEDT